MVLGGRLRADRDTVPGRRVDEEVEPLDASLTGVLRVVAVVVHVRLDIARWTHRPRSWRRSGRACRRRRPRSGPIVRGRRVVGRLEPGHREHDGQPEQDTATTTDPGRRPSRSPPARPLNRRANRSARSVRAPAPEISRSSIVPPSRRVAGVRGPDGRPAVPSAGADDPRSPSRPRPAVPPRDAGRAWSSSPRAARRRSRCPRAAADARAHRPRRHPTLTDAGHRPADGTIRLDRSWPGFDLPLDIAADRRRQRPAVRRGAGRADPDVRDGVLDETPFLDITDRVRAGGEHGLLGLALHPDFPTDDRIFVDYTDLDGNTVVSSFSMSLDGDVADPGSERILLQVEQPFANHNGGAVAFGPDGMLYISLGDGGSGGDPQGNGQRPRHAPRQDPAHRCRCTRIRGSPTASRPTTRTRTAPTGPDPRSG